MNTVHAIHDTAAVLEHIGTSGARRGRRGRLRTGVGLSSASSLCPREEFDRRTHLVKTDIGHKDRDKVTEGEIKETMSCTCMREAC